MSTPTQTHVLAYPFPSSGHVIPLLDFTKTLVSRGINVTVLLTPSTLPLLPTNYSPLLQTLLLPPIQFPNPNQKRLVTAVTFMRQHHYPILLEWARAHPSPPTAIISDFFIAWTHHLARDLHVPRLVFSPSGAFALSVSFSLWRDLPQQDQNSVVSFPDTPNSPVYPWCQISKLFTESERGGPEWEQHRENMLLNLAAWGVVFNTFTELERVYLDHVKKQLGHGRVWAVGPLLPKPEDGSGSGSPVSEDRGGLSTVSRRELITWLDSREDGSVVYVCFGSRTFLTSRQMEVLTRGLELSGVHFILSVREQGRIPCGFADRVREKGFVIEGWAPQLVILSHRAVGTFLTHCGWNSVVEGLVSGVVMLTWPMGADQYTNAKLVVDQLGVAVRAAEGTENVPEARELGGIIERSLESTKERVQAQELRDLAWSAIEKGGSSQKQLDALVNELNNVQV